MEIWELLADVVFLLAACLVGGGLASRVGQSPLVGYLLAGMLVGGPGSLGIIAAQDEIEAVAELGVALLLYSLGLEFSIERLLGLGRKPLFGGVIQVTLTLAVGAAVAYMFGLSLTSAIGVGAMITLSSTAVVLRILMERAETEMPHGRNSLGVLLTQDIAVVPLAVLMTVLGGGGTASEVAVDVGKPHTVEERLFECRHVNATTEPRTDGDFCCDDGAWCRLGCARSWHLTRLGCIPRWHAAGQFRVCNTDSSRRLNVAGPVADFVLRIGRDGRRSDLDSFPLALGGSSSRCRDDRQADHHHGDLSSPAAVTPSCRGHRFITGPNW